VNKKDKEECYMSPTPRSPWLDEVHFELPTATARINIFGVLTSSLESLNQRQGSRDCELVRRISCISCRIEAPEQADRK
jgi:hypothetical protein